MANRTRRQFLEDSMFAAAAAVAASSTNLLADDRARSKSPNERLSLAIVGVGTPDRGRSKAHVENFCKRGGNKLREDVEVTYIVDPDLANANFRADEVAKIQGRRPKVIQDMRKAFEDKSLDIVSTATPNHWHALTSIWAMQHGKDVYVEKPVSHNVSEGRRVVEAARRYGCICQTGTQSRSMPGMRDAIAYVHAGKIGQVKLARGLCYKRRPSIGPKGNYPVAQSVDYDLWLGPAPEAPLSRPKLHYDWHWQWPYGNGDLGNQGIHQMDIARWGLGANTLSHGIFSYGGRLGYEDAGETANTQVVIHDFGDKTLVFEVRGLPTNPYKGASVGVIFEGSEGYLVLPTYASGTAFDREGRMIRNFDGLTEVAHYDNFLAAVRSRKSQELNADIGEGHLSSALCHLGNISYQLGKPQSVAEAKERLKSVKGSAEAIETFERMTQHLTDNKLDLSKIDLQLGQWLEFDPGKETFINNHEADLMLTRQYREPFVVPAAGKV